ncbi:MAG: trehalase family glycosidase [Bacteroidota bacterium]
MQHVTLIEDAHKILQLNWRGSFTVPTTKLYPFQWNWDSGFTALGWCHFDIDKSIMELNALFSGQWANGMIPHIIFHSETEKSYFPNWDFWNSSVNEGAPKSPKTSGITQPPVHGFILETLLDRHPNNEKLIAFAKSIFPKVVDSHRFLYTHRDPEREGLFFIFHPWESGRDNSPLWDESLDRIQVDPDNIPKFKRRDTELADSAHRPTQDQYNKYVYLLELGKKYRYQDEGIFQESPFLVQDTLMNAVLISSNNSLIKLGKRFGKDVSQIEEWQHQSQKAFQEKLWNDKLGIFTPYDQRAKKQINFLEIGGIASLYAKVATQQQAEKIESYLTKLHLLKYQLTPSFDPASPLFDSARYWRGPIWPQMNWMIYHGLMAYGFDQTAGLVKESLIGLIKKLGFYEYFEAQQAILPQLKTGYGGNNFSWTAACLIDLVISKGSK